MSVLGINLHQIAYSVLTGINPPTNLSIQVSNGYTKDSAGNQIAQYCDPVVVPGDVQALEAGEIRQLDALSIQGRKMAFYINGNIDGLIRPNDQGGDLITIASGGNNPQLLGSVWLVAVILEYWPSWTKVAAVLQNDKCYPS